MLLIKLLTQIILLVLTVTLNTRIILLIMLFITSWYMPLKTDLFRETCTYDTWLKPFLPSKHPDRLIYIYVCYCSTWKFLLLWGAIRKWKRLFLLISYLAAPRSTLALDDMLNKKLYPQNDATASQLSYKC